MARKLLLLTMLICALAACEETAPPPGTVAEVNGERISLHSAQALMDSSTGAMAIPPKPSVAEMRESYARAVSVLIAHALVRQELEAKGLGVSEADLDEAVNRIKADYGEAGLEEFLQEASLREDEWRQLVRDHLSLDTFSRRILDPAIRISRDEIRAWYNKHAAEFKKPETWQVCLKSGNNEAELEDWCKGGLEMQKDGAICLSALPGDIPPPWRNDFKKSSPGKCGKIVKEDDQWRVAVLLKREEAKTAKISEVFPLIESAIMAEKRQAAFEEWLKNRLSSANVKAMPGLLTDGSGSGGTDEAAKNAVETDAGAGPKGSKSVE